MQKTGFKSRDWPVTILMLVGIAISMGRASADVYTDSAHGDTSNGVNRTTATCENWPGEACVTGSCAHCHDTFDPNICGDEENHSKMLFSTPLYTEQNTTFCYECHKFPGNSVQLDMPNQRSYSYEFGGGTDTCPGHIKQAFVFINEAGNSRSDICDSDDGSAHHLTSIRDFLQGRWGFGDTLANINPCEGCHDKHKAQRHYYPVGGDGTSPISLPSTHSSAWQIWGDQTTERMDSYASPLTYQAPYYNYNEGGYEPEGNNTHDGSNVPDYVTFCTECHNSTTVIYSEELDRNLYQFDWTTEVHGRGAASDNPNYYDLRSPYSESQAGSYVLSCLDCHEPHGSANSFLTRKWVNGWYASLIEGNPNDWRDWCRRCHNQMSHLPTDGPHDTSLGCTTCHYSLVPIDYTCSSAANRCHTHGSATGGL